MADSYHIIDGKVVPYSGGRKCNDTDAWRDATPLELQLQEQLSEYEHANAAQAAEIEALRAEVEGWKAQHSRDSAELRRLCQHRDEYKACAERLAEALKEIRSRSSIDLVMRSDQFELTAMLGDIHQIADAALAEEDSND